MLQNFFDTTTTKMIPQFIAKAPVTALIFVATIAIWIALEINGSSTNVDDLFRWGSKDSNAIFKGDWWRLATAIFLHAGFLYLAFNMLALIIFASRVERIYDSPAYAVGYMLSGIAGSMASFWTSPFPAVGASGAIFGILGMFGVYVFKNRKELGRYQSRQSLTWVAFIIAINIVIGQVIPNIDNAAHIGGLVMGILLGMVLSPRVSRRVEWNLQFREAIPVVVAEKFPVAWRVILGSALLSLAVIAILLWLITSEIIPRLYSTRL